LQCGVPIQILLLARQLNLTLPELLSNFGINAEENQETTDP
jgi:hypothetical protein